MVLFGRSGWKPWHSPEHEKQNSRYSKKNMSWTPPPKQSHKQHVACWSWTFIEAAAPFSLSSYQSPLQPRCHPPKTKRSTFTQAYLQPHAPSHFPVGGCGYIYIYSILATLWLLTFKKYLKKGLKWHTAEVPVITPEEEKISHHS